jgi:hypothetical protein
MFQALVNMSNEKNLLGFRRALYSSDYIWPPCRHGTRHRRAVLARHSSVPPRVAVPRRAMGQVIGPQHGTWAEYPCRAAHGAQPMWPCHAAYGPTGLISTIKQQTMIIWK